MSRSTPNQIHISRHTFFQKILLFCGFFSSLLYFLMNIFVPLLYDGYSPVTQTISELSAVDAPTRPLWVVLGIMYSLLVAAFGWGVRMKSGEDRYLRLAGTLLVIYGLIGLFWPPMHRREVLAAGGGSLTDTMHLVFGGISLVLMLAIMGTAAKSMGKPFRVYTIITVIVLLVFGILMGWEAPNMEINGPTPMIGVWERINIGAYMVWVVVLSVKLLGRKNQHRHRSGSMQQQPQKNTAEARHAPIG